MNALKIAFSQLNRAFMLEISIHYCNIIQNELAYLKTKNLKPYKVSTVVWEWFINNSSMYWVLLENIKEAMPAPI